MAAPRTTLALLVLATASGGSAARARAAGADACILFESRASSGFWLGRVDFAAQQLVDLLPLPPSLASVQGGLTAGAAGGTFFVGDNGAGTLIALDLASNTTTTRAVTAPPGYAQLGAPSWYSMEVDAATGALWSLLQVFPQYWLAARVFPGNGSSQALSANFVNNSLTWTKWGVAAVDTRRGLLYTVAGVQPQGAAALVGVALGEPAAPVVFRQVPGPPNADIDWLGYSAPLDLLLASAYNGSGLAGVHAMPAGGAGGAAWRTLYEWPIGSEDSGGLGDAALSGDGRTLFVALRDSSAGDTPALFAIDALTGQLLHSLVVPSAQWPDMMVAGVCAC